MEKQSNINEMSIVERVAAPTPPFFKKLRNIGIIIGAVATTILSGGVALPAVLTTVAGYLAAASAVAVTVSQCAVDSSK